VPRLTVLFPPLRVSRDFIDYPYFADLGAVQAAAVLRQAGHDVRIIDALATEGAELTRCGEGTEDVLLGVSPEHLPDVPIDAEVVLVAYTPFHRPPTRDATLGLLLERLRRERPSLPIVLADLYQSGQHVVDAPSDTILDAYPEIDVLIRYEAETVLTAVMERLARTGRPDAPEIVRGKEVEPLDTLPLPAWDLVEVPAYFRFHESVVARLGRPTWAFPIDRRSLPLLTTRGCPYRCAHCSSNPGLQPGETKRQRRHSPAYLARHLDLLAGLGAKRVHVLDELANVNEGHFDALTELLAARDLSFEIPNGVRADHVNPKHLGVMRGRLTTLSISAESGVQRVVDEVVGKDLDLASIGKVSELAQAAGVPVLVHFMIGLPGETRAEINGTLRYALDLHERTGAWPSVQFATPLPGTRLARMGTELGRGLPVLSVKDWGPRFQQTPTLETDAFTRKDLEEFKWTFDERLRASRGPKKVILNVTYKCNNRCPFCAVGTRTQLDGNYERQREFLLKYRRLGVSLLDIDGGEPTLNPRLFDVVRFARKIGFEKVNVTTNGRMCAYEEYATKLVHSGVSSVLFSIHGSTARMHAQNVGVLEAFDQTCQGVRNARRLAPEGVELGANITVTKSNFEHLDAVAELIHGLGLAWLNVQFLTPFGRATSTVTPDTQAAANAVMRVIDAWGSRIRIQVINLPFCFMPGYERYLMGDLLKLERHMIFVNNEEVNLFEYLREQRHYEPKCESCTRHAFCGGFYKMDDVPEPEWLIDPEDLLRPVQEAGLTPGTGNDPRRRSLPLL
jgi:MoaA/NifB/PqqE/SkfB family radical SAM enzyme